MQASAQGLFMLMTNGIGASVGTWIAGKIVSHYCDWQGGFLVAREGVAGGGPPRGSSLPAMPLSWAWSSHWSSSTGTTPRLSAT